jgi:hypothetical protein
MGKTAKFYPAKDDFFGIDQKERRMRNFKQRGYLEDEEWNDEELDNWNSYQFQDLEEEIEE